MFGFLSYILVNVMPDPSLGLFFALVAGVISGALLASAIMREDKQAKEGDNDTVQEIGLFMKLTQMPEWRLFHYFTDASNYGDFTISFFFFVYAVFSITQAARSATTNWDNPDDPELLDKLFYLGFLQRRKLDVAGVLLFCLYTRTIQYTKVNESFAVMVQVIFGMLFKLFQFIVILIIFLFAFAAYQYVIGSTKQAQFQTFYTTFFTTVNGALGNYEYTAADEESRGMNALFFVLFSIMMILLMLNIVIAQMMEAYEALITTASATWAYQQLEMIIEQAQNEASIYTDDSTFQGRLGRYMSVDAIYRRSFMPARGYNLKERCLYVGLEDEESIAAELKGDGEIPEDTDFTHQLMTAETYKDLHAHQKKSLRRPVECLCAELECSAWFWPKTINPRGHRYAAKKREEARFLGRDTVEETVEEERDEDTPRE